MAAWVLIGFATFIYCKITKLLITQQPEKLERENGIDLESLEFWNVLMHAYLNFIK